MQSVTFELNLDTLKHIDFLNLKNKFKNYTICTKDSGNKLSINIYVENDVNIVFIVKEIIDYLKTIVSNYGDNKYIAILHTNPIFSSNYLITETAVFVTTDNETFDRMISIAFDNEQSKKPDPNYSKFVFFDMCKETLEKLFEKEGITDYDKLFEKYNSIYNSYLLSKYNVDTKPEIDCFRSFFNDILITYLTQ